MKAIDLTDKSAVWTNGWYALAQPAPSPNFGPRPKDTLVDLIVLHSISLPPGHYGGDQVQRLFSNTLDWQEHPYFETIRDIQVSSHFYIRRSGDLLQFVSCDARAWHAGVSSYVGRSNCNDNSIGIELEGLEGEPFDDPQYDTLCRLCATLMAQYPVEHIAGHEHIAPGRKLDPGKGFDWRRLMQCLGVGASVFPATVFARSTD